VTHTSKNSWRKSVVATSAALRGLGLTLWLALIGFAVQQNLWELSGLAAVVGFMIFVLDGYHGWLYGEAFEHLRAAEELLASYYTTLSLSRDDDSVALQFLGALRLYRFGFYKRPAPFQWTDLAKARPRLLYRMLYPTLILLGFLVSGLIAAGVIGSKGT